MNVDPIHKAIADHAAACAAMNACLEVHTALEIELPARLKQSNVSVWETKVVPTDDPRWIEAETNALAVMDVEEEAALALVSIEPTTMAGAADLMRYVVSLEATGHRWPTDLLDDDSTAAHPVGKDWAVYLHRNVAALLDRAGAAQAA